MLNKNFHGFKNTGEQNLLESLITESIQMYGVDLKYIPRKLNSMDNLLGEDVNSSFEGEFEIEMFLETPEGFINPYSFVDKLGFNMPRETKFLVVRNRFQDALDDSGILSRQYTNGTLQSSGFTDTNQYLTGGNFGDVNYGTDIEVSQFFTLDSNASGQDDFYNGAKIKITSGTQAGKARNIIDYSGSTKIAVLDYPWTISPAIGDSYSIRNANIRPLEGDLIFFPFTKEYFEIKNVLDFTSPAFYQLGKLYTWSLVVEKFTSSWENIVTGDITTDQANIHLETLDTDGTSIAENQKDNVVLTNTPSVDHSEKNPFSDNKY